MSDRPQKITFAEMRDMGVRSLLVYCADYRCSPLQKEASLQAEERRERARQLGIDLKIAEQLEVRRRSRLSAS